MFTEISSSVFAHSDGFTVNLHSHFDAMYIEGEHVAKMYKEIGEKAYCYWFTSPIKWEPPHDGEPVPDEKQQEIKDRILAALKFRGWKFEVF